MVSPAQSLFPSGHPVCWIVLLCEIGKSNSAPPTKGTAGGGVSDVSVFTPGTPMLPFVLGLDAVIPPTCVPFAFGPLTVTKYDRISVLASHDTNCAFTVLAHSTANNVLSACGVTD